MLKCGNGKISKIFIKNTLWRSYENHTAYGANYSFDRIKWYKSKQRGVQTWVGFDNYNNIGKLIPDEHYFACSTDQNGCNKIDGSQFGELWAR